MTFFAFAKGRKDSSPPDPGKYDIPSTIGQGPKYTLKGRHKEFDPDFNPKYNVLPSTLSTKSVNLGRKNSGLRSIRRDIFTPGPCYFGSTLGEGPKFSLHQRFSTKTDETPGPGAYNDAPIEKGPSYSCGVGQRVNFVTSDISVGPGSYDIPSSLTNSKVLKIMPPGKKAFSKKPHPGPKYDVSRPAGSDCPAFPFPKGPREHPNDITPGPGSYSPDTSILENRKIYSAFHIRHKEHESYTNTAPYQYVPSSIIPKRVSIGNRPPTSYETVSPGPIYNQKPTIVPKKISFGIRPGTKDPRAENPSPDSYWTAPVTPVPAPICGMIGPVSRCPINEIEEQHKPGPADYQPPKSAFATDSKRGFTIKGSRNDKRSKKDPNPPYYSVPSSLGGPVYTIGLRDV